MKDKKELLRFTTAGSVDDGKSTLIGRLLYDSKSIFQDQFDLIKESSKNKGFDYVDLSLLTDGLKSEREQGITIDVAYRYFETPKRKFIIADTPGHIQYTRNMITGASTANLAIILIDGRKGILEQTRRHSFIASLLGIPHLFVCINKMDLIDYSEEEFIRIKKEFELFSQRLNIKDIRYIPISALNGDNIVYKSQNMRWYKGGNLLDELESVRIASDLNYIDARLPIQMVVRPHRKNFEDFRGYAGRIEGGIFKTNDLIKILPSGIKAHIKNIYLGQEEIEEAYPPQSITLTLDRDIDISRGDMIVKEDNLPEITTELDVIVTWLDQKPLMKNQKVVIQHTTQKVKGFVTAILCEIDINTLHQKSEIENLVLNSIGRVKLKLAKPLYIDRYDRNRRTGSIIIIDPFTNSTSGAALII